MDFQYGSGGTYVEPDGLPVWVWGEPDHISEIVFGRF